MPNRKTDTKQSNPRTISTWQPLVSNGFRKVTRKRPCRICHKTDWCGYATDERTSICMRVSDGAIGTARNGGNIHVHNDVSPTSSPRKKTKPVPPSIEIAPVEIRDAVYRELIRISPAQKYYPPPGRRPRRTPIKRTAGTRNTQLRRSASHAESTRPARPATSAVRYRQISRIRPPLFIRRRRRHTRVLARR